MKVNSCSRLEGSHQGEDGKKYGVSYGTIYTDSDLTNGKPVGYIHELVKVEGLPSQKEYLPFKLLPLTDLKRTLCLRDIPTQGKPSAPKQAISAL